MEKLICLNVAKGFELTAFIGLLMVTYYFASNALHEYYEGRSTFSASTLPFTVEDIPTVTVCFKANERVMSRKA